MLENKKINMTLIISGYIVLLLAAYIDNVRGPVLPLISNQLSLSFEQRAWFLSAGQCAGILVNFTFVLIASRISDRTMAIISSCIGLLAASVAPMVQSFSTLIIFAVLVGSTIAAMGTTCNVLVVSGSPPSVRSRALAGLHSMYGVGSFAAGLIVSQIAGSGIGCNWLFLAMIPFQIVLLAFFRFQLPLKSDQPTENTSDSKILDKRQVLAIFVFIFYVGAETSTSMWLSQFLVSARGLDIGSAAEKVSGFFAVMTLTRWVCWLFLKPQSETKVIVIALILSLICLILAYFVNEWFFVLAGILGPFFPVYLSRLSREFSSTWKTLMMCIFVGNQVSQAILNLGIGWVSDHYGVDKAFLVSPILLFTSICLLLFYLLNSKSGKSSILNA